MVVGLTGATGVVSGVGVVAVMGVFTSVPGILMLVPTFSMLLVFIPFSRMISPTVVLFAFAMALRVSPSLMVCMVRSPVCSGAGVVTVCDGGGAIGFAAGVVAGSGVVATPVALPSAIGILMLFPALSRLLLFSLFSRISSPTVVLFALAMPDNVSPVLMVCRE